MRTTSVPGGVGRKYEKTAVAKRWGQEKEEVDEYGCLRVTLLKYKLQFSYRLI